MHGNLKQREAPPSPTAELPASGLLDESQIDIRAIVGLLRRYKWTIVATVVLVAGLAAFVTSQVSRKYTATALVVVDSRDSQVLGFQPGNDAFSGNSMVDTEVEIARSSKVLRRAADELDLANSPDFEKRPPFIDMVAAMFGLATEEEPSASAPKEFLQLSSGEQATIVDQLANAVSIGRLGLTNVISISATMSSPEIAAKTANALADAYLGEQIEAKLSSNERAAAFLQDRVASLARDITAGESALDNFVQTKIAELGSPQAKEILTKLAEEAKQRETNGTMLADYQAALAKQDYMKLAQLEEAREAGLAARRKALVAQLEGASDSDRMADARRQLDALDEQIRAAATGQVNTLQDQISSSNGRSSDLRDQIGKTLSNLQLPNEVSTELFQLQRSVEARRVLYDSLLSKLQQVEQQTDFNVPDSRVIASAVPPARPSFPPTRIILAAALFLGLCGGIGLAFLREHFLGGVTSVEQLENLAGIPVVAAVPRYTGPSTSRPDLAIVNQPLSAFAEAIRRAQLGILPFGQKGRRCIFVTSALPAEGKTTLALSLARQSAMAGTPTLLIDADLRHPSVHTYLDQKVAGGLIGYLSQGSEGSAQEIAIVKEAASGLHFVLGAGASPVSTDTLLMSSRFDDLIRFARDNYATVVIDTPPIGLVVDATIIARHCDAGVFVARYASTSQRILRSALRELERTDVRIYGILNMVARGDSYGYSGKYRHYYEPRST